MAMLFMKDFTVLTKLAGVGVIAVYSYLIFIFYAFFSNTDNMVAGGREGYQSMKYFSLDIGNLAGTIALAFTIHTNFGPMLKCNKD